MSKEMRQHIDKFNKFRLNESENLNISDVISSKFIDDPTKVELDFFLPISKKIRELKDDEEKKKMISCYNDMWYFYEKNFMR